MRPVTLLGPGILLAALLAVPATGATLLSFDEPARWHGEATTEGAQWALLFFDRQDAAFSLHSSSPAATERHTHAVTSNDAPGVGILTTIDQAPPEHSMWQDPTARFLFGASQRGSLLIAADSITLEHTGQAAAYVADGEPVDAWATEHETWSRLYRPNTHDAGQGIAARIGEGEAPVPFALDVRGLRHLEWHDARLECDDACPSGAQRTTHTVGDDGTQARAGTYEYMRATPTGGRMDGEGTASAILLGGDQMDLRVDGWLRLAAAKRPGPCEEACLQPTGQTLLTTGNLSFDHLQPAKDGRLTGVVSGDARQAQYDEKTVDPDLISGRQAALVGGALLLTVVLWKLLGPVLATKMHLHDALGNENRRRIYDIVAANPGISFQALRRRANLASGTVYHHVSILRRSDLIVDYGTIGRSRFFRNAAEHQQEASVHEALRLPELRQLYDWIQKNPGCIQRDILDHATTLGMSRSTAQYRLQRLVQADLLQVEKRGRRNHYRTQRPRHVSTLALLAAAAHA